MTKLDTKFILLPQTILSGREYNYLDLLIKLIGGGKNKNPTCTAHIRR